MVLLRVHLGKQLECFLAKFLGERDRKSLVGVVDQSMRWRFLVDLLHEQAVDCHLKDMRIIRCIWRS